MLRQIVSSLMKLAVLVLLLTIFFLMVGRYHPTWVPGSTYYLLGIIAVISTLTMAGNIWAARNSFLVTSFIASQVLRMLLFIVVLYFFISSNPSEANNLVINFFIIYLAMLIFEISTLLSNLRAEFRKPR